jgi:hypothetical protein
MAIERIIDASSNSEDVEEQKIEVTLRPKSFEEYIGQDRLKNNLKLAINAAKKRSEPVDHILLIICWYAADCQFRNHVHIVFLFAIYTILIAIPVITQTGIIQIARQIIIYCSTCIFDFFFFAGDAGDWWSRPCQNIPALEKQ